MDRRQPPRERICALESNKSAPKLCGLRVIPAAFAVFYDVVYPFSLLPHTRGEVSEGSPAKKNI